MEQAIIDYLKAMNIPVSAAYCKKLIRSHPDYPSLLSIADMLQQLGIDHNIIRMSNTHLKYVPTPCLVRPANGQRNLTTIVAKKDINQYLESTEQEKSVILQIQPTHSINNDDHNQK